MTLPLAAPIQPRRGEIWFVRIPSDPADKSPRPVVIVSADARNLHPRANTVLVVPFSTTLTEFGLHIRLEPGATGLQQTSELQPENISAVRKQSLLPARTPLRKLNERVLREIAAHVVEAMGIHPQAL